MYSGKRSKESTERRQQRKAAKEYIWTHCFNDIIIGESVSRTDPEEVCDFLFYLYGAGFDNTAVPCTFKGVVISDSYGRGAFQK